MSIQLTDALAAAYGTGTPLAPSAAWPDVPSLSTVSAPLNADLNAQATALVARIAATRQALQLADYAALRAYGGDFDSVTITGYYVSTKPSDFAGVFVRTPSDTTSADNGGTIIVDALGRRWKRSFSGAVNIRWFLPANYDGTTSCLSAAVAAWDYVRPLGLPLYHPAGLYTITEESSFPYGRVNGLPPTSLLDCNGVVVYGDGPSTVLKTATVNGADVLQLNGAKNFFVRNLKTISTISGTSAGSNGVSVTGGFDNVEVTDVWCENLAYLDKGTYLDGGKAFSIQTPTSTSATPCGNLRARIYAKGCVHGVGVEQDLVKALAAKASVDIEYIAEDCYIGATYSAGEASGTIPANGHVGISIRGSAINCQRATVLSRAQGVTVDTYVKNTKAAAARRLNPSGTAWDSSNSTCESLYLAYGRNCQVAVHGYMLDGDRKAAIGGATSGSAGFAGATTNCVIRLDVGGTVTSDIVGIDSGGNTVTASTVFASTATATAFPTAWYAAALSNDLTLASPRFVDAAFSGSLSLFQTASGTVQTGAIGFDGSTGVSYLQGTGTSSANAPVAGLRDAAGTIRLGVVNGAGIVIPEVTSTAATGAYVGKLRAYTPSGTLLGVIQLHADT